MARGYMGKLINVNLTTGVIEEEPLGEEICRDYIEERRGATDSVMTGLREFLGEPDASQGSGVRDQGPAPPDCPVP